jgi:hypothetical protein
MFKSFSRKLLFLFGVFLPISLISFSCINPTTLTTTGVTSSISSMTSPATTFTESSPPTTSIDTELPYRIDSILTISTAPKLGESADLTFTVDVIKLDEQLHPKAGLAKSKAWIDFYWTNIHGSYSEAYSSVQIPLDEVEASSSLSWNGSYNKGFTLKGKFQLPKEGIWNIRGHFVGEGWSYGTGAEVEVAVADGTAAIMNSEGFKSSPIAYLGDFTYGRGGGPIIPDMTYPLTLGLDISKAPRVGEEVILSCRVNSLIDVSDFSIQWSFYKGKEKVPEANLLTSKDLGWKTDIKKGEPVIFSTAIKFPTDGDWQIFAGGKSGTKFITGAGDNLKFTITSTRSYFVWIETPVIHTPIPETGVTTVSPR